MKVISHILLASILFSLYSETAAGLNMALPTSDSGALVNASPDQSSLLYIVFGESVNNVEENEDGREFDFILSNSSIKQSENSSSILIAEKHFTSSFERSAKSLPLYKFQHAFLI